MDKPSLVTSLFAAYNNRDFAAVEALYAADATHEDVATGHPKHGPNDIVGGLVYFLGLFPDANWALSGHLDGPAFSTGWYHLTGTLQSDLGKISAANQELDLRGVMVVAHDGGHITSTADYWDMQTFQRQMSTSGVAL